MAIYLGDAGHIELQRQGARGGSGEERVPMYTTLQADDVNVNASRFSFLGSQLGLITGDQVEIATARGLDDRGRRTLAPDLELVDGHVFPDWVGYVNIDPIGGVRLYKSYDDAIKGERSDALALVRPSKLQRLYVTSRDNAFRCLAQIRSYSFTTERDTVDVTTLNEQYRNQYHQGLISGQGSIDCFWEHTSDMCDGVGGGEYSAYLAFLCIRLEQGASFTGRFYIYDGGEAEKSVWYECQAVVTKVVVDVEPSAIIGTSIEFITTGPVRLQTGYAPFSLLQEQANEYVLQEGGDRIKEGIVGK